MPRVEVPVQPLLEWGRAWAEKQTFSKKQGMDFGKVFDAAVGSALAAMLGGLEIVTPNMRRLLPDKADAVEVGPVRIVGGVRSQNFDVGYRPDGVRFVFDSKTLNNAKSMGKNYQNMVNDLATEATTVHTRYPYAVVAFMVIVPAPCVNERNREAIINTLERLSRRDGPLDQAHKAEVMSLVLWQPATGEIDAAWPGRSSPLRIEEFSAQVQRAYVERYKGLPPHDEAMEQPSEQGEEDA